MSDWDGREARFLADLFHKDRRGELTAEYACVAAAEARRRQAVRRGIVATAAVLTSITISLLLIPKRYGSPAKEPLPESADQVAYESISTNQLLSELRDRPFLVVYEGKQSKVVFLNEK